MKQIEVLKQKLETCLPGVTTVIDEPLRPDTPWMLDVFFDDQAVNVEWRPHRGFGVSSRTDGYGEGPDEIYSDIKETVARVIELLKTGSRTVMPFEVTLPQLRERLRLSQAEVAQRVKVSQAAISELESNLARSQLRTLEKFIKALGAELEVRAVLPNEQAFTIRLSRERVLVSGRRVPRKKSFARASRKGKT